MIDNTDKKLGNAWISIQYPSNNWRIYWILVISNADQYSKCHHHNKDQNNNLEEEKHQIHLT